MSATTVAVLGSTGSIGTQTLEVMRAEPGRFRAIALGANSSVSELAAQAAEFKPAAVGIGDPRLVRQLRAALPAGIEVLAGPDAFADLAGQADVVVNGVVGFAGLGVTLAALRAGRRLALANKGKPHRSGSAGTAFASCAGRPSSFRSTASTAPLHQCLAGQTSAPERLILTGQRRAFQGPRR